MKNYFLAEKLKYRHTFLRILPFLMPLVLVGLSAWLTNAYFTVDCYNWWYIGLYPGMIGIVCAVIGGKDKKKKNAAVWPLPCDMAKIWDAKVLVGAILSGIAMVCTILLTIAVGTVMENVFHITQVLWLSVKAQLLAGFLIWLTTLWQVPFCLFLSQKLGMFGMLLLHMGSYTLTAAAISLKSWFAFFPGAITSWLMCAVLGILPNGLLAMEGQMTYAPELMELRNLFIGIPAALAWFFVFWLGSRIWYQRQVTAS